MRPLIIAAMLFVTRARVCIGDRRALADLIRRNICGPKR